MRAKTALNEQFALVGKGLAHPALPGAVSIPADELAERVDELPDTEIVASCRGRYCVLPYDAVRVLTAHGRRAVGMVDGTLEWRLADLPVESVNR